MTIPYLISWERITALSLSIQKLQLMDTNTYILYNEINLLRSTLQLSSTVVSKEYIYPPSECLRLIYPLNICEGAVILTL